VGTIDLFTFQSAFTHFDIFSVDGFAFLQMALLRTVSGGSWFLYCWGWWRLR
jgi:hypothetical protein